MSEQDENETQGVVFGVLAAVVLGVIALVVGLAIWATTPSASPAAAETAVVLGVEESDTAPQGEALAQVFFAVGSAAFDPADAAVLATVQSALVGQGEAIVLLSGFHDESGDPAMNAELARQRALAVREALLVAGVPAERIKLRKPESTLGQGSPEESRRVDIRVQ
ncbi:MAG: OmpA family protein [Dechloromonas sp.]|nr:OmpA family protein [Dechloromonas sp.]